MVVKDAIGESGMDDINIAVIVPSCPSSHKTSPRIEISGEVESEEMVLSQEELEVGEDSARAGTDLATDKRRRGEQGGQVMEQCIAEQVGVVGGLVDKVEVLSTEVVEARQTGSHG